jgi:hypothetical protein
VSLVLKVNGRSIAHNPTGAIINVSALRELFQAIAEDECDKADREFGHSAMAYKCGVREALSLALRAAQENQR